jgi:hypothetical protein
MIDGLSESMGWLIDAAEREDILVSAPTLAQLFGLPEPALRKRLERWEKKQDRVCPRHDDKRCRGATVNYNVRLVLPVLRELAEKSGVKPGGGPG